MLKYNPKPILMNSRTMKMKLNSFATVSLAASSWPGDNFFCMDSASVYMIALLLLLSSITITALRRYYKNYSHRRTQ